MPPLKLANMNIIALFAVIDLQHTHSQSTDSIQESSTVSHPKRVLLLRRNTFPIWPKAADSAQRREETI